MNAKVVNRTLLLATVIASMVAVSATAQQGGVTRTPIQTVEFPPGYQTVTIITEIAHGSCTGRHTHPGTESAYNLDGETILKVDGKPDQVVKAGSSFQLAPGVVHDACNMSGKPV